MSFTFPSRYKEYPAIKTEVDDELSAYNSTDILEILDNKLTEYENKLASVSTEINRVRYEIYVDLYKKYLEDIIADRSVVTASTSNWEGYPELTDPEFNIKIFNKKEFRNHQIEYQPLSKHRETSTYFKRTSSQEFIGTYMSPFTPYSGVLLWHGVGVGKTCAGVTSAENYRKFGSINGKIIVLVPNDGLITTWRNEIFNVVKELEKKKNVNVQCTGSTYMDELGNFEDITKEQKIRRGNKLIDKYYEFYGYRSFSNMVKKDMTEIIKSSTVKEYLKLRYIKNKFSNRVFILDEVHFTRQYANSDDNKDIAVFLDMIARYGENNKFIMASATPMYNACEEIISIINLLLLNDKRSPIEVHDVFEKDGYTIKDDGAVLLEKKTRGYISYLRGENPITFPVKIYPNIPNLSYQPNPSYYLKRDKLVSLPDAIKIKHMGFIRAHMSEIQYGAYYKALMGDEENEKADNFSIPSTVASNIVFPVSETSVKSWGDEGFDDCFTFVASKKENKTSAKYKYKPHAILENNQPFLDESNLAKYSQKFKNIFDIVSNSNGIVFIYSKYIKPGVLSMALMLEQNGYKRFSINNPSSNNVDSNKEENNSGVNILDRPGLKKRCYCGKLRGDEIHKPDKQGGHAFKQGTYIMLYGETKQKELATLIAYLNDLSNMNGEIIKIVLGTNRVEQGVSFFNVREVHIVDPWHHFNRTEQVVGRAIRQISHKHLPPEKKNVSVFLHCSSVPASFIENPEKNVETTDERTYRNAYFKSKKIAEVTRLLKRNAVDCLLNKNGNQLTVAYFGNVENRIETSQGIILTDQYFGDKDGDVICDFVSCEYDCTKEVSDQVYVVRPNEDTYNDILSLEDITDAKNLISVLFQIKDAYTLPEIINIKDKNFPKISNGFMYKALNDYIYFREVIYDKFHRSGYLIYRDSYYIFQPHELDVTNIGLTTRTLPLKVRPTNFAISEINKELVLIKKPQAGKIRNLKETSDVDSYITLFKRYISKVETYASKQNVFGTLGIPSKSTFRINFDDTKCNTDQLHKNIPNCSLPPKTIKSLLAQYMIFSLFDRLAYENKKKIFTYVLTKNIENGGVCSADPLDNLLETSLFRMYDKKCPDDKRYTIYRMRRDLKMPSENGDLPYAFKLINHEAHIDRQETYFMYDDSTRKFNEVGLDRIDMFRDFNYKYDSLRIDPDRNIFGYVQEREKNSSKKKAQHEDIGLDIFDVSFYLVNKTGHKAKLNRDGSKQSKSEIKGAVCGTAIGSKDKSDLIRILMTILEYDPNDIELEANFTLEFTPRLKNHSQSKHSDPNTLTQTVNDIETYKFLSESSSLCELIELLLRHRQYIDPTSRWFYNFEEWTYIKNLRRHTENQMAEEIKKAKAAQKLQEKEEIKKKRESERTNKKQGKKK
jgi:hypothetical protein